MTRVVTYSRSITIIPTYTCHLRCRYCSFWSATDGLIPMSQARALMRQAYRAGCREALIMSGDAPWLEPGFPVDEDGYIDFVYQLGDMALREGLLPHTNIGVVAPRHLARLREVNPSMGLMLESVNDDLPAHRGPRGKRVGSRLAFLHAAGEQRIAFTTGLLVGIGESAADRRATLETIRDLHARHGHVQEIIVQNFRARPGTPMARHPEPPPELMVETVRLARALMPAMSIQIPPNLNANYVDLILAGANDLGGVSPDVDHINPDHRFPPPRAIAQALAAIGCTLRERLPVYPETDADWTPTARRLRDIAAPAGVRCVARADAADGAALPSGAERWLPLGAADTATLAAAPGAGPLAGLSPLGLAALADSGGRASHGALLTTARRLQTLGLALLESKGSAAIAEAAETWAAAVRAAAAAGLRCRAQLALRAGEDWTVRIAVLDRLRALHLETGAFDGLVVRAEPGISRSERLRALAYARLYCGKEWPDIGLSWADGPEVALDGLAAGGSALWDVPASSWAAALAALEARGLAPRQPCAMVVGGPA
jgi:FO synthase subunit 1